MNCEETQPLLSAYLDGQVDETQRRTVEAHLSTCAHCRADAAALRQTIASIGSLSSVEPPPGFSQRVMAQVREEARRPSLWRSLFFPLWAKIPVHAAAALVIGGLAVYLYQTNDAARTVPTLTGKVELDRMAEKLAAPPSPEQAPARSDAYLQDKTAQPEAQEAEAPASLPESGAVGLAKKKESTLEERERKVPPLTFSKSVAGRRVPDLPPDQLAMAKKAPDNFTLIASLLKAPNEPQPYTEIIMTAKSSNVDDASKQLGELAGRLGGALEPVNRQAISNQKLELLPNALHTAGYADAYSTWLIIPHLRYPQFKTELITLGTINWLIDPAIAQERYRIKVILLIPKSP